MMNRAKLLLQQIGQRAAEQAHRAVLGLFAASAPALLLAVVAGWAGLLVALLFLGIFTLKVMVSLQRVMMTAVFETAAVYSVRGRIVEFQVVPELHIVGAE